MTEQKLGHYRILGRIGAGGMGEVYRAHDEQLDRDVAIKLLPAQSFADDNARARLLREARAAAALNHPHICTIHEVGEADGQAYIAMELVEGRPLSEVIPRGGLPTEQALRYGSQIADALAHAHERGIIHRDLKSGNVVITADSRAKVLDFGLAKRMSADELVEATTRSQESLTQPGAVLGTLPYMAPEQLRGQVADARSDVWALGVVLHEMAAGTRPFQGQTGYELSSAILSQAPGPLPAKAPVELRAVIDRCLAKEPAQRYQRAGEVRAALEALASGTLTPSPRAPARGTMATLLRSAQRPLPLGIGVILVVLALLLGVNVGGLRHRLLGPPAPKIESIAVLPLANLSGDPQQEYFADGMTEALITELSKIRAIKVVSRTSAMQYKGVKKPMPQIARELGVDALIEGSVAREGDQVRITVQLIHGPTDKHLWAESYQRELRGVLALQSEVARAIAREIRITVTPAEQAQLARASAVSPAAHEAYLLGRFYANKRTENDLRKAIGYFEEAIKIDPSFALGYAGLADAHRERSIWGDVPFSDSAPLMRAAALKALELDDSLAEGHTVLGAIRFNLDWDWTGADQEFQRALELNPNSADAHAAYAYLLMAVGRLEEAIQRIQRARELDPLSAAAQSDVGRVYYRARQYEKAIDHYRKGIELDPTYVPTYYRLTEAYEMLGKYKEAESALEEWRRVSGPATRRNAAVAAFGYLYALTGQRRKALDAVAELKQHGSKRSYSIALIYTGLGDKDQAIAWLEKTYQEHGWLIFLKTEPKLDPLRSDPRFQDLLRRMNFPE